MKHILITGATGNIGKGLTIHLLKNKYKVSVITRDTQNAKNKLPFPINFIKCDLSKEKFISEEKFDVVINLAKESLITKSLTSQRRREILEKSETICKNLVDSFDYDIHFIHFSGTSCYKESLFPVTENSPLDNGFFGELARKTESKFEGKRATILRLPLVLSNTMPLVSKISLLYRFMLGPKILSNNTISYVHTEDLYNAVIKVIESFDHRNLINVVGGYIDLKSFHKKLCDFTNRFNFLFLPKIFIKILMPIKSKMLLKNSEVTSIHAEFLDLKLKTIDDVLIRSLNHLKTPTLNTPHFHYEYRTYQYVPENINTVFDFFKEAKNLEEITPDKLNFKIEYQSTDEIKEGTQFDYKLKLNGLPFRWTTFIENWNPPMRFTDYQTKGPYQVWYHTHSFYELEKGTLMVDDVKYRLPLGMIGDAFGLWYVSRNVKEIFSYRYDFIKGVFKSE